MLLASLAFSLCPLIMCSRSSQRGEQGWVTSATLMHIHASTRTHTHTHTPLISNHFQRHDHIYRVHAYPHFETDLVPFPYLPLTMCFKCSLYMWKWEAESVILGFLCQEGRVWVQPYSTNLQHSWDSLNEKHLKEIVNNMFLFLPSDKQQGLWDSDCAPASVQRFGTRAAAHPGELTRTEASRWATHKKSCPVPQDCPHQLPHWWVMPDG